MVDILNWANFGCDGRWDYAAPFSDCGAEHRRRDLDKDPYTAKYRDVVKKADFLIFIYPIWWSSMPAILKGLIDRVFVQGYAYRYNGVIPVALLKNKKAWIITTNRYTATIC
ncbi:NAD(P)H-dependent oxidoreductase [Fructobacillus fructosus]|uniref:NAD(P)H-dependent oxidoreductase n=1 Tax=Fructobacillus fructosus TaxID=1631 RepID=UPI00200B791C|nr:NAD(P)H-dependent oxidoreductase [Fructobacillus fructosus]MCK8638773.1 NAD(P)H-dependent oxidoreductase [Fructobacillus fructosus]